MNSYIFFFILSSTDEKSINNNEQGKIGMNFLQTINQFMMKSEITQPSYLPRPSSILRGKQIRMSGLDMAHRQFSITLEENYQYQ